MTGLIDQNGAAIIQGIKTVGVGKKGSKSLSPQLVEAIDEELCAGRVAPASKGAFFAGLLAKGIEPQEAKLVTDPGILIEEIVHDAPDWVRLICRELANGKTLDLATAYELGRFLFSGVPGDGARGFIASNLRVRYETSDEYEGIRRAMHETISTAFEVKPQNGDPIVQLVEPFDGNDHSYLITPLAGHYVQGLGYRVIHQVGRNSGPKMVMNLYDVAKYLRVDFVRNNEALSGPKPEFGWFYDQADVSLALNRWVDLRHQTVKRPFLATLEKFIDPAGADIIVCSAFHPPYGEKMLTIGERAGFKGVMVIRNGIEGSCGMPLLRCAKLLLSAKQQDGSYVRKEIEFDVPAFLGNTLKVEEKRDTLDAQENARLIMGNLRNASSGDEHFDARVRATHEAMRIGLEYIKERAYGLG